MEDKNYFKKLANDLCFDLSDEEAENIVEEFKTLIKQLELLNVIDTDNVEEMIYPFEEETSYLREDEITNVISVEDALLNASDVESGHVRVPKVVR